MRKFFFILLGIGWIPVGAQQGASTELCFTSDTQKPMWVETLYLKKDHNQRATKMLFDAVAKRKPAALYIMGDVVNLGYSEHQWNPIDRHLKILRDEKVAVFAVLGNHEVMGEPAKGRTKFQERFPDHSPTGYVEVQDSVAVVLLNSNFGTLSESENAKQVGWYKETLQKLDADSSIQFIISGCHHSPYTNSTIVTSNKEVQEKFVPLFLASQKSRLFISGHSHNFEHFQKEGKDFLVIGGGGGLHQPLRTGAGSLPDLSADYKPEYHYLIVKRVGSELKVRSVQLKKDFTGFEDGVLLSIKNEGSAPRVVSASGN
ncbi:MAG: metallophosphoesterase family protein [Flavisolibacter sp.]